MGAVKHYLNDLICACAPEDGEAQVLVEEAIHTGTLKPTGQMQADVQAARVLLTTKETP